MNRRDFLHIALSAATALGYKVALGSGSFSFREPERILWVEFERGIGVAPFAIDGTGKQSIQLPGQCAIDNLAATTNGREPVNVILGGGGCKFVILPALPLKRRVRLNLWAGGRIYGQPAERWVNSRFVHLLNAAANVVTDQLREHLVFHRHVSLAPQAVAKFPLDHTERRFDIRPDVIPGEELFRVQASVMEHLFPQAAFIAGNRVQLEWDQRERADRIDFLKVRPRRIAHVARHGIDREPLNRLVEKRRQVRRIVGALAVNLDSGNDVRFDATHDVRFDPNALLPRLAVSSVLFIKPAIESATREARRISREFRFQRLQGRSRPGDQIADLKISDLPVIYRHGQNQDDRVGVPLRTLWARMGAARRDRAESLSEVQKPILEPPAKDGEGARQDVSEELLQMVPQQIGRYTYYRLGSTTMNQLRDSGIIPKKNYDGILKKKPDGLVAYHGKIIAVVEYKLPAELKTDKRVAAAIKQEVEVAKALCNLLIITDSTKTYWVNALNGERVRNAEGVELRTVFHPFFVKNTATIEYLLEEVSASLTEKNSTIRSARLIDPTPLATRLWQTIWVATGKSPVKCLYNVVELFIFKFLSDLKILPADIAFESIRKKAAADPEDALDFYAKNTRKKIYKLFPAAPDGTTIINGTIFVAENGEANLSQSILFRRSLDHLHRYGEEFGSLTKIDKQFKTKLYESFLKQEVEALGQYFTPRKIIQSMIRMANLDSPSFQFAGKRICDPFCGVGGFPLELLNMNEGMRACYRPTSAGKISLPFVINGFDKGFERDDERTIILAKANMLVYLAELLFNNPSCSKEFSRVFNETFALFKDNLGTFGHIVEDDAEKYDVILSNPPYVTSGTNIIKEELARTPRTKNAYPINALGLESLSLEWIVRTLRPGGRAFIVIPDGILGRVGGKKLRDFILRECYLDALVSLPVRTFFPNFEHTYILALTKKHSADDVQTSPVFTYLVSNIGERITSIRREEIDDDDLPEMENLFRVFAAARGEAKAILEKQSGRCKIQDISRFATESHWVINRWWTVKEKVAVGAEEGAESAGKNEVDTLLSEFNVALSEYDKFLEKNPLRKAKTRVIELSDENLFRMVLGKRVLTTEVDQDGSEVPVYSANVFEPMGKIAESNIGDFSKPAILWGIDGKFEFRFMPAGEVFATTDHCGTIQILDTSIVPEYLLAALHQKRIEESFDRSFRASISNMKQFSILVPVEKNGTFDVKTQKLIAERFTTDMDKREKLGGIKARLDDTFARYVTSAHLA